MATVPKLDFSFLDEPSSTEKLDFSFLDEPEEQSSGVASEVSKAVANTWSNTVADTTMNITALAADQRDKNAQQIYNLQEQALHPEPVRAEIGSSDKGYTRDAFGQIIASPTPFTQAQPETITPIAGDTPVEFKHGYVGRKPPTPLYADTVAAAKDITDAMRTKYQPGVDIQQSYTDLAFNGEAGTFAKKLSAESAGMVAGFAPILAATILGGPQAGVLVAGGMSMNQSTAARLERGDAIEDAFASGAARGAASGALMALPLSRVASKYLPQSIKGRVAAMMFDMAAMSGANVADAGIDPIVDGMRNVASAKDGAAVMDAIGKAMDESVASMYDATGMILPSLVTGGQLGVGGVWRAVQRKRLYNVAWDEAFAAEAARKAEVDKNFQDQFTNAAGQKLLPRPQDMTADQVRQSEENLQYPDIISTLAELRDTIEKAKVEFQKQAEKEAQAAEKAAPKQPTPLTKAEADAARFAQETLQDPNATPEDKALAQKVLAKTKQSETDRAVLAEQAKQKADLVLKRNETARQVAEAAAKIEKEIPFIPEELDPETGEVIQEQSPPKGSIEEAKIFLSMERARLSAQEESQTKAGAKAQEPNISGTSEAENEFRFKPTEPLGEEVQEPSNAQLATKLGDQLGTDITVEQRKLAATTEAIKHTETQINRAIKHLNDVIASREAVAEIFADIPEHDPTPQIEEAARFVADNPQIMEANHGNADEGLARQLASLNEDFAPDMFYDIHGAPKTAEELVSKHGDNIDYALDDLIDEGLIAKGEDGKYHSTLETDIHNDTKNLTNALREVIKAEEASGDPLSGGAKAFVDYAVKHGKTPSMDLMTAIADRIRADKQGGGDTDIPKVVSDELGIDVSQDAALGEGALKEVEYITTMEEKASREQREEIAQTERKVLPKKVVADDIVDPRTDDKEALKEILRDQIEDLESIEKPMRYEQQALISARAELRRLEEKVNRDVVHRLPRGYTDRKRRKKGPDLSDPEAGAAINPAEVALIAARAAKKAAVETKDLVKKLAVKVGAKPRAVWNWLTRWFGPRTGLRKIAHALGRMKPKNLRAIYREAHWVMHDLNDALIKVYGTVFQGKNSPTTRVATKFWAKPNLTKEQSQQLNDYLQGKIPLTALHPDLQKPMQAMRKYLDRLTFMMRPFVADSMKAVFDRNIGAYLHRSYRINTDPLFHTNWSEADKAGFDQAVAEAKIWVTDDMKRSARESGKRPPTQEEIDIYFNDFYLHPKIQRGLHAMFSNGASQYHEDLSVLRKRGDIPEVVRRLWGEETDVGAAFMNHVALVSNLMETRRLIDETVRLGRTPGEMKFLFKRHGEEVPPEITGDDYVEIHPHEGSDFDFFSYKDEKGQKQQYWTTKEMSKLLFEQFQAPKDLPWFAKAYLAYNFFVKAQLTVLNAAAQARNNLGSVWMMAAQGVNPFSMETVRGVRVIATDLLSLQDEPRRNKIRRYAELGVIDENAHTNEIMRSARDTRFAIDALHRSTKSSTPTRAMKAAFRGVVATWEGGDNLRKIIIFEKTLKDLKKAYPEAALADLEVNAANRVRRGDPTYSEVPDGIIALRNLPMVAPFPSFQFEIYRNHVENIRMIREDFKDPRTRPMAWKRLIGLGIAAGGTQLALSMYKRAMGYGDDEEDAMKQFVHPARQSHTIIHWLNPDKKSFSYLDMSQLNPYDTLARGARIAHRSIVDPDFTSIDAIKGAIYELFQPFASTDPGWAMMVTTAQGIGNAIDGEGFHANDYETGRDIAKLSEWGNYVAKKQPELASALRFYNNMTTPDDPSRWYDEVWNAAGVRPIRVDMPKSIEYAGKKLDRENAADGRKFADGMTDIDSIGGTLAEINQARVERIRDLHQMVKGLEMLGWTEKEIRDLMKDKGFTLPQRNDVINGRVEAYDASSQMLDRMTKEEKKVYRDTHREIPNAQRLPEVNPSKQ